MKHSDNNIPQPGSIWAAILQWALPVLLTVPNIALCFTEHLYSLPERLANFLLPAGVYFLLCAAWRRIGITTLLSLPLMILCAFQIVLLYLYGESIIAVDMFLNVVTTNVSEATELLANLVPAIVTVCLLYLPPLALAIVLICSKKTTTPAQRHPAMVAGAVMAAAGIVALAASYAHTTGYSPVRRLFPLNVCANIGIAAGRTGDSDNYFRSSADFSFDSRCSQCPDSTVYVLVIGETSRACNWQLGGYDRNTNPRLSRRSGITFFGRTLSESNTTHKSVPLMMSHLDCRNFGDSIHCVKGIIDAFKEAGFSTAWISNQERNGALIDFFGEQADSVTFLTDDGRHHLDMETVPILDRTLQNTPAPLFVAIHTYGSHFNYRDRVPRGYGQFFPDDASEAETANRAQLINAYDNSILYTDAVLDSIIGTITATGRPAALLYLADHGEDIFDDDRGRFLHASPTPTYYQIHVPLLVWTSQAYRHRCPEAVSALEHNSRLTVSSSRSAFHTLLNLAGIVSPYMDSSASLASDSYVANPPLYLNDYNESVGLGQSGLRKQDFRELEQRNLIAPAEQSTGNQLLFKPATSI